VLHTGAGARLLASPVDPAVGQALADHGVSARAGRVLLAQAAEDAVTAMEVIDITLTATRTPPAAASALTAAPRATISVSGQPPRPFTVATRVSPHVRHQHKYTAIPLPPHRRFYFHTTGEPATAATLEEFSRPWQPPPHGPHSTIDHRRRPAQGPPSPEPGTSGTGDAWPQSVHALRGTPAALGAGLSRANRPRAG
jgi:hypothetical protein